MSEQKKSAKKWQEKEVKQAEKSAETKRKREAAFIPPEVWDIQLLTKNFTVN